MDTPDSQRLEKISFWVLLGILLVAFLWLLKPFYAPLLFSLVIVLVCEPLYAKILKGFRGRRYLAAVVSLLLLFIFLAIPFGVVASLITEQILKVAQAVGTQLSPDFWREWTGNGVLWQKLEKWREMLGLEIDIKLWIREFLQNSAQYLYQFSPQVVARTANFFLTSFLTLLFSFFLLVDGPRLYHAIVDFSPLENTYEKTLAQEVRLTLRACIYGYVLTALTQALLATIGFAILKLDAALLLGVATFIMAFVPIIGTASVWVPVFVFLLLSKSYGQAAFLFFYGTFVISGVDNILRPLFITEKTKIHPVLLFLVIFGGLKLWGPIGILAGPVLVAILFATLKIYKRDFRQA